MNTRQPIKENKKVDPSSKPQQAEKVVAGNNNEAKDQLHHVDANIQLQEFDFDKVPLDAFALIIGKRR